MSVSINANTGRAVIAETIAAKLEASAEFREIMAETLDADETRVKGPVAMLRAMQQALGAETLATLPRPGSDTGNNPDWYKVDNPKDPNGRQLKSRVLKDVWLSLPEARQLSFVIGQCTAALDSEKRGDAEKAYQDMTPETLRAKLQQAGNRLRNGQARLDSAIKLYHVTQDVAAYPGVELTVCRENPEDDNSPIADITDPFSIWKLSGNKRTGHFQQLSAVKMLRLDIPKAIKAGGGYDNLFPKRQPKAPTGKDQKADALAIKHDSFVPVVANVVNYLEAGNGDNLATVGKLLATADDHTILTIGRAGLIWETQIMPKIQSRFDALLRAEQRAREQEAEAKLQGKPAADTEGEPVLSIKLGKRT